MEGSLIVLPAVVPGVDGRLAGLFDDEHVDHSCGVLAGAAESHADHEARQAELEAKIRDCDLRLARYREALEHVGTATVSRRGPMVGGFSAAA